MEIKLKNIYHSERLSEETNAFQADVYINGKKAAVAGNEGHGGPTSYHAIDQQGKELVQKAEEYCKELPPLKFNIGDEEASLDMNLELFIDELLESHLRQKEQKRFDARFQKDMQQSILWGIPGENFGGYKMRLPIADYLKSEALTGRLIDFIQKNVTPKLNSENILLNTNIPEAVLQKAGLTKEQYVKQEAAATPKKKSQQRKGRGI